MITYHNLCDTIQETINTALDAGWNPTSNRKYECVLHRDAGQFVQPTRNGNIVQRYLNGSVQIINQQNDTTTDGDTNSVWQLQIQLSVPLTNANNETALQVEDDIQGIRLLLDEIFAQNTNGFLADDDENVFAYSQKSSVGRSVERVHSVYDGDAVVFMIYTNWTFIQNGSPSRLVRLALDGHPIAFSTLAINREESAEMGVPSQATTIDAKAFVTASNLSITVQMPTKLSPACEIITRALLVPENNVAHLLTLAVPISITNENGEISATILEESYYVAIRANGYSAEMSLNASTSVTFSQIDTSSGIATFSEYAAAHPIT